MLLRTLGELSLDGSDFREQKPLLLLAYLALTGKTIRNEIAERFWGASGDLALAQKGLQEALRKLRRLGDGVVLAPARGEVATGVRTDVMLLEEAMSIGDPEHVLALYRGPFLPGVERNERLKLGEELREWIVETREALHGRIQTELLRSAEELARNEAFEEAARLAWTTYRLGPLATYLTPDEYLRYHTLLLAGGMAREAAEVERAALELYDDLEPTSHPYEARARLTHRAGLPAPTEVLYGREGEIEQVLTKLQNPATRIVTVVGPPGIGKTELAIAVAHEVRERQMFPRGLAFVSCERLPPEIALSALLEHLAAALHLAFAGAAEPADLARAIGERRTLIVLDNFEHLVDHRGVLDELVRRCPALTLLVTSRRVLDLEREHLIQLGGLRNPDGDGAASPAVELFAQAYRKRAGDAAPIDPGSAARIARLTGGLPLALLLAAGWGRSATPEQIADRLEGSLDLLETEGSRDRNLLLALAMSHDLLSPRQQRTFGRLVVFHEGFALDAAGQVAGATLRDLRGILDHSLLRRDTETGRYGLHPIVRRYARERLTATGERAPLEDEHARYFLALLQQMISDAPEVRNGAAGRLRPDLANIGAAWRHAAARGWTEILSEASEALEQLADVTARYRWGIELLRDAERVTGGAANALFRARSAGLHLRLGALDTSRAIVDEVLDTLDPDDRVGHRVALRVAGACLGSAGDFRGALPVFERALALEEKGSGYHATVLTNLGLTAANLGDEEAAERYLAEAIATYERLGRLAGQIQAAQVLTTVLQRRGAHRETARLVRSILPRAEAMGNRHRTMLLLRDLAAALLGSGDLDGAEAAAAEATNLAAYTGNPAVHIGAQTLLAKIAVARDDLPAARDVLLEAVRVADDRDNAPMAAQALIETAEALFEAGHAERVPGLLDTADRLAPPEAIPDWLAAALARMRQNETTNGRQPRGGAADPTFEDVVRTVREAFS